MPATEDRPAPGAADEPSEQASAATDGAAKLVPEPFYKPHSLYREWA